MVNFLLHGSQYFTTLPKTSSASPTDLHINLINMHVPASSVISVWHSEIQMSSRINHLKNDYWKWQNNFHYCYKNIWLNAVCIVTWGKLMWSFVNKFILMFVLKFNYIHKWPAEKYNGILKSRLCNRNVKNKICRQYYCNHKIGSLFILWFTSTQRKFVFHI